MKYKVVCTDIDGTLLDARRQLSQRTITAFRRLPENVAVILASSRMPSAMTHLQEELGISGSPLICYNGGYVIYFVPETTEPMILHDLDIPLAVCESIVGLSSGTSIHCSLYHADSWFAPRWDEWTERESTITKVEPDILDSHHVFAEWAKDGHGAHKVMCMGPAEEMDQMEKNLRLKHADDIHIYRSRPTYLELAPIGISKGTALASLVKELYETDMQSVISFGDNYNDVELVAMSGFGVAVANAREEVKSVASRVAPDSREDGVAIVLEEVFNS